MGMQRVGICFDWGGQRPSQSRNIFRLAYSVARSHGNAIAPTRLRNWPLSIAGRFIVTPNVECREHCRTDAKVWLWSYPFLRRRWRNDPFFPRKRWQSHPNSMERAHPRKPVEWTVRSEFVADVLYRRCQYSDGWFRNPVRERRHWRNASIHEQGILPTGMERFHH